MSRCTEKSNEFINEIIKKIDKIHRTKDEYRTTDVNVYYDAGKWSKRDYVAKITVPRDWDSYETKCIKERMRSAGATNIIGGKRHAIARDYLDLAFDIKKSKMKELGIGFNENLLKKEN